MLFPAGVSVYNIFSHLSYTNIYIWFSYLSYYSSIVQCTSLKHDIINDQINMHAQQLTSEDILSYNVYGESNLYKCI